MTNDTIQKIRLHKGKGLSPAEVLIHSLCDGKHNKEDIFNEVAAEIKNSSNDNRDEFERCLEALKKRGLIVY